MANNNADINLLAGLNIDSSEAEILKAIKIIEKRLKANHDARFKLNVDIDETVIRNTVDKLQNILNGKELKIETKTSIEAITKEVNAMSDIVTVAKKAATEKLEFAKANEKVRNSADDTAEAVNRERNAMDSLGDVESVLNGINRCGQNGNSVFQRFGNTLRDAFSTYTAVNLLEEGLNKVGEAGREALEIVKDFDDINVDLQMATGEDKGYVKQLMADYSELGGELGTLTQSVAESADTFLRQGRSIDDTNQLIEDSIVLSKIAKTSSEESSEILTATINGFKMAANEGSKVNDVLSSIDLNSASDASGIGSALTKVASMANNAGVSLEKTAAMIATIKDVTQDADTTIGTSLKTVLSRMNSIRAGKFIDEETGEALNDVEKVLGEINVSMRDVNGQFKEAEIIIDEVGMKWKTLDSNTQKAVTTAMGGTYQANKLVALFDNYDKVIELTNIAKNSTGQALQKFNESYLSSLEAKTQALQNSLQQLATTTISDELYASVLDVSKEVVDLTTETGILKSALIGLGVGGSLYTFSQLAGFLRESAQGLSNFSAALNMVDSGTITTANQMQMLVDLSYGLSNSQMRLLLSTNNLTDAQKIALMVANGVEQELAEQQLQTWGLINAQNTATSVTVTLTSTVRGLMATLAANPIVLVTMAVTAGITAFNKYKQAQEEVIQAAREASTVYKDTANSVDDYVAKYQELHKALLDAKDNEEQTYVVKQQLLSLQTELNEKFGEEAGRVNLVTDAYKDQTEAIKELSKVSANEFLNSNRTGIEKANKEMDKDKTYHLGSMGGLVNADELDILEQIKAIAESNNIEFTGNGFEFVGNANDASEAINSFMNDIKELQTESGKTSDIMSGIFDGLLDNSSEALGRVDSIIDEYGEIYDQAKMAQIAADTNLSNGYNNAVSTVEAYNEAVLKSEDPYNDENVKNAWGNLQTVKQRIQENEEEWGQYSNIMENVFAAANDSVYSFYNALKDDDSLSELIEDLRGLSDIELQSMSDDGNNGDTFDKLTEKAREYGLEVQDVISLLQKLGAVQGEIISEESEKSLFSSFDNTNLGERLQHVTDLFNEGEISHKQYFDALQNELENVDFTKLTDSLEDANEAAQQFFTDSVQQASSGLSSLINSFDADEISVSEYLDGYLSIADTINTLTDDLQENSAEWNKNGEAISDSTNTALDQAQSDLQNAMNVITEFQDSTYALEQIMSGSVERTSDDFHAYTNLIAADLAGIVAAGGEMADEISSYMGTTTEEIANALLEDTSNFSVAEQAIAQNTNVAIQNMAESISTLIDNLGKAISDFKVDISFGLSEDSGSLWDAITGNGELKFTLGASGESLSAVGNAISSFGSSLSDNLAQQLIQSQDYHRGTEIEGSNYKPNGSVLKSYEDELDRVKDASSSAKKEFSEDVDFFKERIEELDNAFSLLDTNLNNIVGSFAKNKLVDAQIGLSSEKVNNYTDALAMYTQKANEALSKLPADIAEKVKNGSVSIVDFVGSGNEAVVDAIKEYDKWADEISSCQNELAELQQTIEDLELSKFENIAEDFSNMFDLRENGKNLIDQTKEWIESSGQLVGSAFFDAEIDQSSKQLALLEEEKAQLVNQMTSALASGRVKIGSETWLSMLDIIAEVESNILNTKTCVEEFNNSIQELHWENVDRITDRFSDISEEINNLIGLIDDVDVSDKNGNWSKEGLVQIGLYAQEYERAVYASQMYAEEIEKLNQAYTNGEYSLLEYQERLASLTEEQWNNINASQEALDSIKQLNESRVDSQIEGINKEIEKYEELINAQIESLRAEKELNDYKKSITNKTDEAEKLQREIIAMQNDTSASTTALRLQKEAELADKLAELQELEYEHSIESQEDALNKQFEDYEETRNAEIGALKESLNDQETLIAQSFETVKQNATLIGQQISNIAKQHGVIVSDSLITSWQSGENAIASYGTVLSAQSSAFIGNIMGVENEVWNLQAQANSTANSLAWMFSTQADNLVNELAQSYYAEGNLMNMTNALQQSLVNTLERGYNINGITSALGSITSNLNSVTSAANSAASALQNMYNQQERVNYAPTPTEIVEVTKPDTSLNSYMNETLESRNQPTSNSLFNNVLNDRSGSEFLKNRLNKYASGVHNLKKDELAWTQDGGGEIIISPSRDAVLTPLKAGDTVLTKAQTDNIFDWSKFNPDMFVPQFARNIVTSVPEIVPKNVNNAPSLHLDKLVEINGNVGSSIDVKQVEAISNKACNNLIKMMYDAKKYGSY